MNKRNLFLIGLTLGLAVVYVIFFTDWFRPQTMQIFHTNRSQRARPHRDGVMPTLIFGINRQLRLTEIEVLPLTEWQTNSKTIPLWHLVTDSNSVPVKQFFYGQNIGGMRPAVKGARSQALETNVTYRLFVTAGKVKGQHDFTLK